MNEASHYNRQRFFCSDGLRLQSACRKHLEWLLKPAPSDAPVIDEVMEEIRLDVCLCEPAWKGGCCREVRVEGGTALVMWHRSFAFEEGTGKFEGGGNYVVTAMWLNRDVKTE